MINATEITIKQTSRKGAALIEHAGAVCWIRPAAAKALAAGKVQPSVEKALAAAANPDPDAPKKTPYHKCKPASVEHINDLAVKIVCHDGSKDVFPVSQLIQGNDCLFIPAWLVAKKNVQVSAQKVWK